MRLFFKNILFLFASGFAFAQSFTDGEFQIKAIYNPKNSNAYSPVVYNNSLFFVSDNDFRFGIVYTQTNKKRFQDIFYAPILDAVAIGRPKRLPYPLTSRFHDGSFCITSKGIYITRNADSGKHLNKKKLPLHIFYFERNQKGSYHSPVVLDFSLSDTFSTGHPYVIGDSLMYFVAEIPGGFGGADIYYSCKKNNVWQHPINCGPSVNSSANELFPSWFNGNLFFSSDRQGGSGKMDVYFSSGKLDDFTELKHLPSPINSVEDDFGVFMNSDGNTGYFSSARGGNDAIYYFQFKPNTAFNNCEPIKFNRYCYTFYEQSLEKGKDSSGVIYEWNFGDGIKSTMARVSHCFPGEGKYLIELNMIDRVSGAVFLNKASYELNILNEKQLYIDVPDTICTEKPVEINAYHSNLTGLSTQKYNWRLSDGTTATSSKWTHVFTQPGNYTIQLIASGLRDGKTFTSCVSRNVYVQAEACSAERRIPLYFKPQEPSLSSVKKTSIPTGISPAIENGYLSNVYESFKRDSLSNYRIHLGASDQLLNFNAPVFKGLDSISMFSINGRYQYFYGKYKSTSVLFPVLFKIKDLGFNPFVFSFTGDVMDENFNPQVISRLSELKLISEDNPLALKIYFAKGEYTFSADDKQAFLDFMRRNKAENFLIEIEGHTDNQGTADQNLELAKKRAETARQFLLQNGFSDNRIVEISSEHLLGPGTDEDQQKKNRFVQIRLIIKK